MGKLLNHHTGPIKLPGWQHMGVLEVVRGCYRIDVLVVCYNQRALCSSPEETAFPWSPEGGNTEEVLEETCFFSFSLVF